VSVQIRGHQRPPPEARDCARLPRSGEEEDALLVLCSRGGWPPGASRLVRHQHGRGYRRTPDALRGKELLLPKDAQQRPAAVQRGRGR